MTIFLPVVLLGCSPHHFVLTDSIQDAAREGVDPVVVAPWEDGLRTDGDRGTVEWWYFDSHFDDGSTVVANFMTKGIMQRGKALTPRMEITVTEPDGTTHQSFVYHPGENFSSSPEGCAVRIGASTVQGDLETYTLHLEGDGVGADLVLQREVTSWRPGAGKVYFDADLKSYLGWVVPVPRGTVTGTITVGDRTWAVAGSGYHDHNWTNTAINKPLHHWYWGRGYLDNYTVLFFAAEGSRRWGRAPLDLFMLADGPVVKVNGAEGLTLSLGPLSDTKPPYPLELDLSVNQDPMQVRLAMGNPVVLESDDLLSSFSPPVRSFLHLFTRPWYYRLQVDTNLAVQSGEGTSNIEAIAIYEYMTFK